jgi:hypothetical protein
MVKCYVLFEVRAEFFNTWKRGHAVHVMSHLEILSILIYVYMFFDMNERNIF